MGKMSEMAVTIQELRELAARANGIADWLSELYINRQADVDEVEAVILTAPAITPEEVRARLAELSRDGYTDEIRALIRRFGAGKLSELEPGLYPALMKEAEKLGGRS